MQEASKKRAAKNWRKAKVAVTRKITKDMLGVQRKCAPVSNLCSDTQQLFLLLVPGVDPTLIGSICSCADQADVLVACDARS